MTLADTLLLWAIRWGKNSQHKQCNSTYVRLRLTERNETSGSLELIWVFHNTEVISS